MGKEAKFVNLTEKVNWSESRQGYKWVLLYFSFLHPIQGLVTTKLVYSKVYS